MKERFGAGLIILVASCVAGALSGAIASWMVGDAPFRLVWDISPSNVVTTSTSSEPETGVTVIPIDRRGTEPGIPPTFLERKTSVANVFLKPARGGSVLGDEALLGQAVAVTSDGWFMFPYGLMEGHAVRELLFWHQGITATATSAILDERSSVVFVKTDLKELHAPAFTPYQDVAVGTPVWLERRPGSFIEDRVTSLSAFSENRDGILSRRSNRRPGMGSIIESGDEGAPVWGADGRLIGILMGETGGDRRLIPASVLLPSLNNILNQGESSHADLGVRSIDLAYLRILGETDLPQRGAWIQGDKTRGLPAIEAASPALSAKLKEGDVIVAVDRDILDGTADLTEVLAQYRPGSEVTLTILRGTETLRITLALGNARVSRIIE